MAINVDQGDFIAQSPKYLYNRLAPALFEQPPFIQESLHKCVCIIVTQAAYFASCILHSRFDCLWHMV